MTRMTSLRAALLVASGLLAACSSDTDSTESSAGIMTLEFEIEAAQIDDHPFPSDVYLDRAFLTQPMGAPFQTPILATPTFRGLLGLNESQRVGGFSVSQAGALNLDLANPANTGVVAGGFAFLNQLSTNFRNGYSTTTPVVIPFSSLPGEVVDAGSLEGNVLIFDIGIPVFGMTADGTAVFQDPANPAVALTAAQPVAIGDMRINTGSGGVIVRPREPFATTPTSIEPFGRRTYAVVVLDRNIRTNKLGRVVPSAQYEAIRRGDITNTDVVPAAIQPAVQRYFTESQRGLDAIATQLGFADGDDLRRGTLAYFQFTVTDDTRSLRILREIADGRLPVNRSLFSTMPRFETVGLNTGDPLDISINRADPDGPDNTAGTIDDGVITTSSGFTISDFYTSQFGPFASAAQGSVPGLGQGRWTPIGLSSGVVVDGIRDLAGNISTDFIVPGAFFSPGILTGGTLTLNPGANNAASFEILSNTESTIRVFGDVRSAIGTTSADWSATPRTPGAAVPQTGIARITSGTLSIPDFLLPDIEDLSNPGASTPPLTYAGNQTIQTLSGVPFFVRTMLGTSGITPVPGFPIPPAFIPFNDDGDPAINNNPQDNPIVQFRNHRVPYLAFFPNSTAFPGNRPVVIGIHGFGRRKEDLMAAAATVTSQGNILVLVDVYQHGVRQLTDGNFGNSGLVVAPDPTDADGNGDVFVRFTDPFINPTLLALTRDKIRTSLFDLFALTRVLGAGVSLDGSDPGGQQVDPTQITVLGQSLGGILGTMLTSCSPDITAATLNVPGGGLLGIIDESDEIAPSLDALLLATANADTDTGNPAVIFALLAGSQRRMTKNSAVRDIFNATAQSIVTAADPLTYGPYLLAPGGGAAITPGDPIVANGNLRSNLDGMSTAGQPRVLFQFVLGDSVVPNSANRRLAISARVGADASGAAVSYRAVNVMGTGVPNPLATTFPPDFLSRDYPLLFGFDTLETVTATPTGFFPANPAMTLGSAVTTFPASHGFILRPDSGLEGAITTSAAQTQALTFLNNGVVGPPAPTP